MASQGVVALPASFSPLPADNGYPYDQPPRVYYPPRRNVPIARSFNGLTVLSSAVTMFAAGEVRTASQSLSGFANLYSATVVYANAQARRVGTATIAGHAQITATGARLRYGPAALSTGFTLTATALTTRIQTSGSTMATGATVAADYTTQTRGQAAMAMSAQLTATGQRRRVGTVPLHTAALMTTIGSATSAQVRMTTACSVSATGRRIQYGRATLSSVITSRVTGFRYIAGHADLTTAATVAVDNRTYGSADLHVTTTSQVSGHVQGNARATLKLSAFFLNLSGRIVSQPTADLTTRVRLTAFQTERGDAALTAGARMIIDADRRFSGDCALTAGFTLNATGNRIQVAAAKLTVGARAVVDATEQRSGLVLLASGTTMVATGVRVQNGAADLVTAATVGVDATTRLDGAAELTSTVAMTAEADLTNTARQSGAAFLDATSSMTASAVLIHQGAAVISTRFALRATPIFEITGRASVKAAARLVATGRVIRDYVPPRGIAHVAILEAIGPGPTSEIAVTGVQLLANDAHTASSTAQTLTLDPTGAPTWSCERWLRVRFTPPFGQVGNFRVWAPQLNDNDSWQVNYGLTDGYIHPAQTPSMYAYQPLPATDPGPDNPNAGRVSVETDGIQYTPWLVLQASSLGGAADDFSESITLHFAWTES